MNFLFNLANHGETGQRSLEDVIGIIGRQLGELGHGAIWETKNERFLIAGGYNVVVEGFNEERVKWLAEGYAQGARFICIATEEPGPTGFNQGLQQEMRERQEVFPEAARYIDGILHLVPGDDVTRWYSQFAPAAPIELGYARKLVRHETERQLRGFPIAEPEFDFGFYGSMSPRRRALLQKLAYKIGTRKAVRFVSDFAAQDDRDKVMQNTKVIVQIRRFEEMGLVSSSRCNTALCIGRPVVAEPHLLSHPWDEVIKFAKTDEEFLDLAVATRAAWRGVHAGQFAKFKEKFSPERCIGQALRTIGITGDQQRLAS